MSTTNDIIERLRKLHEEATPAPWDTGTGWPFSPANSRRYSQRNLDDEQFVCELRNALPLLLAEREAMRKALEKIASGTVYNPSKLAADSLAQLRESGAGREEKCPFCEQSPCAMEDECRSYAAAVYRANRQPPPPTDMEAAARAFLIEDEWELDADDPLPGVLAAFAAQQYPHAEHDRLFYLEVSKVLTELCGDWNDDEDAPNRTNAVKAIRSLAQQTAELRVEVERLRRMITRVLDEPAPAAVAASEPREGGEWVALETLPDGALFETWNGVRAVKSEYLLGDRPNHKIQCILLESGEYAHFNDNADLHNLTVVREIALPAVPTPASRAGEEALRKCVEVLGLAKQHAGDVGWYVSMLDRGWAGTRSVKLSDVIDEALKAAALALGQEGGAKP